MFQIIFYILLFLFGGALGSFAGVAVDRLYVRPFLTGRSYCDKCGRKLDWLEMIPVFSYLFLKGCCRKCQTKIGSETFYLELVGGILAVVVFKFYLLSYFAIPLVTSNAITGALFFLLFSLLYIVLAVIFSYDLRHKLVPMNFALILSVVGVAFEIYRAINYSVFYGGINQFFWLDLFSGFLIALPFLLIYLLTKRRGVGLGDIMIYFGVGYLAGFTFGISILFISIWLGALVSIFLMLWKPKKYNKKSKIPFTPFIIIATLFVMLFQIDILGLIEFM